MKEREVCNTRRRSKLKTDPCDASNIQPFLPSDSSLQALFPPREWAVRLPALILVVGLGGIGAFVGKVMIAEEQKRKEKAARVKQG